MVKETSLWDKIMYGSDMIFGERYLHICAKTGREAVYLALASMIDDDIIDEQIAITIAHKILRDNAAKLYKIGYTATNTENVSILNNVK